MGPKSLSRLQEEGFFHTGDLLLHLPRFYQDRRQALSLAQASASQEDILVEGRLVTARSAFSPRSRRRYIQALLEDDEGRRLTLVWFNSPGYLLKSLGKGRRVRVYGRLRENGGRLEMIHPDLDFVGPDSAEGAEPEIRSVYAAIGEISSGQVKKLMAQSLEALEAVEPLFPPQWLNREALSDPCAALVSLHRPPASAAGPLPRPAETKAWRQLALLELLAWRLMMLKSRHSAAEAVSRVNLEAGRAAQKAFWAALPFAASEEQRRVAEELTAELEAPRPMSRLLQGEVGGGKTVVAGAALFLALGQGGQGALMAPTEVLARQHFDFLAPVAEALGFRARLLTGAMSAREKKDVRDDLASGRARLAVGSQALLSGATIFENLTLAVIDEQQRFGVRQRLALRRKNLAVDLLAMSATPIPRTLALMLYGDLERSELKGLLPGRRPAETSLFEPRERGLAYAEFLRRVEAGSQGFVVTARIGEGAAVDSEEPGRSLDEIYNDLRALAPPQLALVKLHGAMEPRLRAEAMKAFRLGRAQIMVATSIIEVGVDVASASVILIEGAERFGLAQLHQLRGRVGRGGQPAWCLLLAEKLNPVARQRLEALTRQLRGPALAELDLKLRGPGEQWGLRQSGWPRLSFAALPRDLELLPRAQELARELWEARDESQWADFWRRVDLESWTGLPENLD